MVAFAVVVFLESDPGADDFFKAVAAPEQRKTATVGNEAGGFPRDEDIIAIVIDVHFHVGAAGVSGARRELRLQHGSQRDELPFHDPVFPDGSRERLKFFCQFA